MWNIIDSARNSLYNCLLISFAFISHKKSHIGEAGGDKEAGKKTNFLKARYTLLVKDINNVKQQQ